LSLEHSPAKQQRLGGIDAYRILTFKQWIALVGVSRSTGLRILDSGSGPPKVRLSERRFGIRLIDHQKWCERLARDGGER
jgi:predicted DNA-binding transcriptional regulator AlpA